MAGWSQEFCTEPTSVAAALPMMGLTKVAQWQGRGLVLSTAGRCAQHLQDALSQCDLLIRNQGGSLRQACSLELGSAKLLPSASSGNAHLKLLCNIVQQNIDEYRTYVIFVG